MSLEKLTKSNLHENFITRISSDEEVSIKSWKTSGFGIQTNLPQQRLRSPRVDAVAVLLCACRIRAKGIRVSRRFPACVSQYATPNHKIDPDNPLQNKRWERSPGLHSKLTYAGSKLILYADHAGEAGVDFIGTWLCVPGL